MTTPTAIMRAQDAARKGQGWFVEPAEVMKRLLHAAKPQKDKPASTGQTFQRSQGKSGISAKSKGRKVVIEFEDSLSRASLQSAFEAYLKDRFSS